MNPIPSNALIGQFIAAQKAKGLEAGDVLKKRIQPELDNATFQKMDPGRGPVRR